MIVDSSALVAIALQEPDYEELISALGAAPQVAIGAPTLVETGIVLSARLRRDARGDLARLVQEVGIEVVPFTTAHFGVAMEAWLQFGRGRHAAKLNFGDCLTYAIAKTTGRPLLCVGNDFPRTDLVLV
ncbi:MAG: type II toxin-antitoxin system VapC family toxin [Deltaproteobacteria bacterium]|nr:type II toxin-antitoxin system VapC family toxin [Deltaproteobacteria bacterium]